MHRAARTFPHHLATRLREALKIAIDQRRTAGCFILTGSANVLVVPVLADSLAGCMAILRLHPLFRAQIERMWQIVDTWFYPPTIRHMAGTTGRDKVLKLARRRQGVTARELAETGIHRQVLTRLVADGELERVVRGLYRIADEPPTEHHGLVMASAAVPQGVVCLLSALQFHGIGTQLPSEVWIAIDRRARRPALKYPPLRIVRYSGAALLEGIEVHRIEGRTVRVYDLAKTVVDCFKYRNKIGIDVALEALREAWRARRFTMATLDRYAGICRVQRVMRPYLEVLVA